MPRSRLARWLLRTDRCATGVEMGIIAIPFVTMMLTVMEVCYDLYVQAELDNVATLASRLVQVGSSTGVANETSASFVASTVCPIAGGLLNCGLITAAVAPVPTGSNYYSAPIQQQLTQLQANTGQGICTGAPEQMMVLRLWYDGPSFVGLLMPSFTTSWNGHIVHETVSTAGFVNEYFAGGGQATGSACSL